MKQQLPGIAGAEEDAVPTKAGAGGGQSRLCQPPCRGQASREAPGLWAASVGRRMEFVICSQGTVKGGT